MLIRLLFALLVGGGGTISGRITIKKHDGSDKKDYSEAVVLVADVIDPPKPAHAEIRQRGKEFVPRVSVVAPGTAVAFPNDDKVEHNVFSHSSAADFDLGRFGKGSGKSRVFDKPGVAEIFCNVHKEMVAYLVVSPGHAFAVTGPDGKFEIKGVPPGKHKVQIWERFARPRVQEETVEVPAGGSVELVHEVVEQSDADPPHKNKFGVEYPANYH